MADIVQLTEAAIVLSSLITLTKINAYFILALM